MRGVRTTIGVRTPRLAPMRPVIVRLRTPSLAQKRPVIVRHSSPETVTERPGPEPPQKLTAFSESSLIWTSPIRTAMITASSWL